jgi:hypothetical protein
MASPLETPVAPIFKVPTPELPKNPAGLATDPAIRESYKAALLAQKDYADALERRYAQPNWFNVASGFLKPQLGGFFASLGSAGAELGKQAELQRAMAPTIAQMRSELAMRQVDLAQRMKAGETAEQVARTGQQPTPGQAATTELFGKGPEGVAGAAQTAAREIVGTSTAAATASGKDPTLSHLQTFTQVQTDPQADPKKIQDAQAKYDQTLNAARPPQVEPAQWEAMSRYQKQEEVDRYARLQREAGMGVEQNMQQQAGGAPRRLTLLGSVRDLAMGVGLKDEVDKSTGQTVTGRQQMERALGVFTGNNPLEVIGKAASEGRFGQVLQDLTERARQLSLTPAALDQFQKLVKLLAENQVSLRGTTVNPTDAASAMQQMASPNIGNTQRSLLTLVDLMALGEQHAIDKYKYVLDSRIPSRQLPVDQGFLQKQSEFAKMYREIATRDPLAGLPNYYSPGANVPAPRPASAAPAAPAAQRPAARPSERTLNGKTYVRQDGRWVLKED